MHKDCTQNGAEGPGNPEEATTILPLLTVTAAMVAWKQMRRQPGNPERQQGSRNNLGNRNVPRQLSNTSGRKRTAQGPCGLQAPDRREVRRTVLHHQLGWEGRTDLSVRRVAGHRAEAFKVAQLQPHEKEVPEQDQLLRPASGDGRTGPVARSGDSAVGGRNQG